MTAKLPAALIGLLVVAWGPNGVGADRVDDLIHQFLSKSPGFPSAARELRSLGDPKAVGPMIKALKDQDENYRVSAILILEAIAAKATNKGLLQPALEPLITALNDPAPSVRRNAALVLATIGDQRAIPRLGRVAKDDKDSFVREDAGKAEMMLVLGLSSTKAQQGQARGRPAALQENQQGLSDLKTEKIDEAIGAFKRAVESDPTFAEAVNNLGFAYERAGKLDGAIVAYERAIELDPNRAVAYLNLGSACAKKWEKRPTGYIDSPSSKDFSLGNALKMYQKAVELNANLAEARAGLGEVYARAGFPSQAITEYEAYLSKRPNGPRAEELRKRIARLRLIADGGWESAEQVVEALLAEHDPLGKNVQDIEAALKGEWAQLCGGDLTLHSGTQGRFPVASLQVECVSPDKRWLWTTIDENLKPPGETLTGFCASYLLWAEKGTSFRQRWNGEKDVDPREITCLGVKEIKTWQTRDGQIELGIDAGRSISGTGAGWYSEVHIMRLADNRWREVWTMTWEGDREGGENAKLEDTDHDGIPEVVVHSWFNTEVWDAGNFGASAGAQNIEGVKIFKESGSAFSMVSDKVVSTPYSALTLFLRKLMDRKPDEARLYVADPNLVERALAWGFDQVNKWGRPPSYPADQDPPDGRASFQFGGQGGESGQRPSGAAAQKYEVEMRRTGSEWKIIKLARVPGR